MKRALHPSVDAWFHSKFSKPTGIQKSALAHTLAHENTLILAPTGSGKTLAAFLSVLSRLAEEAHERGLPNTVRAVYVSPLKALDRDIHRNLEPPLEAINAALPEGRRVRMEVRTGDTDPNERSRQGRLRPHLLLTTPESLSAILSQTAWRDRGFDVRTVIVDEIHAFAENKRGALLTLALERLEARATGPLQRIGLSATAWPEEAVTGLLCGDRPCFVAEADVRKAFRLGIETPHPETSLPPVGYNPYRIAGVVADLVEKAHCSLIFTSTRSAAERLGLALNVLLPDFEDRIAVHHGSIDRDRRFEIEAGLAEGVWKAVVCSTSLELGVDFAAVDQVLLVGAPRGVSRALQRIGRSGHRVDGVAEGALVPLSLADVLECTALREAVKGARLDALQIPKAPLDVLAQVLLGMSIERTWPLDEAFDLVRQAFPYRDLTRYDFDAIIEYLSGGGRVLGGYETYGKIVVEDGGFRVADRKVARQYYMNTGVISDTYQVQVVARGNRRLGEVEEGFLAALQPGEAFIMGGRCVKVKYMQGATAIVEPASGERVLYPRWMGAKMPLSAQLAREQLALRRLLREAWERGGRDACYDAVRTKLDVPEDAARRIASFVARQNKAAPIPVSSPLQIERVREGRAVLLHFHVLAGRAINRSLAWVVAKRTLRDESVVANFDDQGFLLSVDARRVPDEETIRAAFSPLNFRADLRGVLESTETLGRRFRGVAEIGQLLPRRTLRGQTSRKSASWSGSLLYKTLMEYEPDHPLLRECVRGVMEDECDADGAEREAARIGDIPFEIIDLPRPSPFGLQLYAAFNRETLMAQDPERALDDLVATMYSEWQSPLVGGPEWRATSEGPRAVKRRKYAKLKK